MQEERIMNCHPIEFPPPNMTVAIETLKKGEEEKLSQALAPITRRRSNTYWLKFLLN